MNTAFRMNTSDPRNELLKVDVSPTTVSITIGIDALLFAVTAELEDRAYLGDDGYRIVDKELFVRDIAAALTREEENGSTAVHRLFDQAAIDACENGTEAVSND
jgi:hypothetical protein